MHPCIGTYKENLFIQHQCPDISPFCSIRSQQFVKSILSTGKKVPSTKRTAEISTLFSINLGYLYYASLIVPMPFSTNVSSFDY